MLKRTLMFTTPVYLSLRNQQLVLTFKEDPEKSTTIPIEDVGMVILEHQQAIATLPALNALTEGGVQVVLCNAKGMPSSMLQSFTGNNLQGEILRHQLSCGEVLKKQLWKQIVESKIRNQAALLKKKGRNPVVAGLDIYRPAAIEQLRVNAEKVDVPMFSMEAGTKPADIAKGAVEYAKTHGLRVVLLDTAGRLHIDEGMMGELEEIKKAVLVDDTILVVDAMTGQDAVNVASSFDEKVGIDGVILTKLDGDTRGGAALSIRAVTGKPIFFTGMGEKLTDLEPFYPDRMASRILGMGDVLSLIEKAESAINEEDAKKLQKKIKKADFDFNDYLMSMEQMKKMGGLTGILGMMPGINKSQMEQINNAVDDKKMAHINAIIYSMTEEERSDPKLMSPSRKNRIAKGAGVDIAEVNRFIKQFTEARKMMKKMPGMMKNRGRRGSFPGFPF